MSDMKNHPITPPPELIWQWWQSTHGAYYEFEAITKQAAQWGADQELKACCNWLGDGRRENLSQVIALRSARRPKPLSLKKQALEILSRVSKDQYPCNFQEDEDWDTIRRALEQLPND